jgi:hypothetical protein
VTYFLIGAGAFCLVCGIAAVMIVLGARGESFTKRDYHDWRL